MKPFTLRSVGPISSSLKLLSLSLCRKMAHFLALPPEVRRMIYEYCLSVEEIRPYQDAEYPYLKENSSIEY